MGGSAGDDGAPGDDGARLAPGVGKLVVFPIVWRVVRSIVGLISLIGFFLGTSLRRARSSPRRTAITVGAVAVTIAVLVVVTGVALGLADDDRLGDEADVRIVPEAGGSLSSVVDVEGPRLGDAHAGAAALDEREDVTYATPVLLEAVQMQPRDATDEPTNVLAVGVVPPDTPATVAGVSTAPLAPGDPYYADGAYDGERTGETVLTTAAASQLEASEGDQMALRSARTGAVSQAYTVTAIDDGSGVQPGPDLPVIVLRLSELQALTGAADDDLADQVLVATDDDEAIAAAEATFPEATVVTGDSATASIRDDEIALATGVAATLVALVVCSLFVATTVGLLVERERRTLAILAAVGFTGVARAAFVGVETLVLTAIGGVAGVLGGVAGIGLVNLVAGRLGAPGSIAAFEPVLAPYAIAVAIVAGLVALPYPLVLARRTTVHEELHR